MKIDRRLTPIFVWLLLSCCAAAEQTSGPSPAQIETWTRQLGDDDFTKRLAAQDQLKVAGESARTALEAAAKSDDAEIKSRADRLLQTLKTEPILKKMAEAIAQTGDMEGDVSISMKMMAMDMSMHGHFKGSADGARFVMDLSMKVGGGIGGEELPMHMVSDGTTMWSEVSMPDRKNKVVQKFSMATMQKLSGGSAGQSPLQSVKQLRTQFDFTDTREETINGETFVILEGKLRDHIIDQQSQLAAEVAGAQAAQVARQMLMTMDNSRIYIDKKTMLVRKTEVRNDKDEVIVSSAMEKLKLNIKLDDKEFAYTPPAGVTVMDMEELFKQAREAGAPNAAPNGAQNAAPVPQTESEKMHAAANDFVENGEPSKAVKLFEDEVARLEKAEGADSPKLPDALMEVALFETYTGNDAAKIPLYERAIKILEKIPDPDAEKMGQFISCVDTVGEIQLEQEHIDEAIASHTRAKELFKKAKPGTGESRMITAESLDENLAKAIAAKKDREEAKQALPELNGVKPSVLPSAITRIVADPAKSSADLIAKGAKELHKEDGFVVLKEKGIECALIKVEFANEQMSGNTFGDGDVLYDFHCSSDAAKQALIAELKLKDPLKIQVKEEKAVQDHPLYKAGPHIFVSAQLRHDAFCCFDEKCKSFMTKRAAEGKCPDCQKGLKHMAGWE